MSKKKTKQRFERTISEDLHKAWRDQIRVGDSDKLATLLEVSKPTVDKALIYGCVHQERIVEVITNYFAERIKKENGLAQTLTDLAANN